MEETFNKIASKVSHQAGKPSTFLIALTLILIWSASGPMFSFSETWQLVVNTATTIITFLMVFLIQNSQNRDGLAIQAKLDELIHASAEARDDLEHIEDMSEKEIEEIRK